MDNGIQFYRLYEVCIYVLYLYIVKKKKACYFKITFRPKCIIHSYTLSYVSILKFRILMKKVKTSSFSNFTIPGQTCFPKSSDVADKLFARKSETKAEEKKQTLIHHVFTYNTVIIYTPFECQWWRPFVRWRRRFAVIMKISFTFTIKKKSRKIIWNTISNLIVCIYLVCTRLFRKSRLITSAKRVRTTSLEQFW